jgi:mono/diheme cytochrome c family protein
MHKLYFIVTTVGLILTSGLLQAGDAQPEMMPRGKIIYDAHCMVCHGAGGRGDGPSVHALIPKPPDFTSPEVKAVLTTEKIVEVTTNGKPGTQMGGWKKRLTPEEIQAIAEYIRTLK